MAAHSSVLAWRIPGMGSHRVGHDWSDLAAVPFSKPFIYSGLFPGSVLFSLVSMFVFMSVLHCFDYWSFVISFEIRKCSFFFFKYCFGYLGSFQIAYEFYVILFLQKKNHWDFSVFVWAAQLAGSKAPKNSRERKESLPQWSMQRNRGKQ